MAKLSDNRRNGWVQFLAKTRKRERRFFLLFAKRRAASSREFPLPFVLVIPASFGALQPGLTQVKNTSFGHRYKMKSTSNSFGFGEGGFGSIWSRGTFSPSVFLVVALFGLLLASTDEQATCNGTMLLRWAYGGNSETVVARSITFNTFPSSSIVQDGGDVPLTNCTGSIAVDKDLMCCVFYPTPSSTPVQSCVNLRTNGKQRKTLSGTPMLYSPTVMSRKNQQYVFARESSITPGVYVATAALDVRSRDFSQGDFSNVETTSNVTAAQLMVFEGYSILFVQTNDSFQALWWAAGTDLSATNLVDLSALPDPPYNSFAIGANSIFIQLTENNLTYEQWDVTLSAGPTFSFSNYRSRNVSSSTVSDRTHYLGSTSANCNAMMLVGRSADWLEDAGRFNLTYSYLMVTTNPLSGYSTRFGRTFFGPEVWTWAWTDEILFNGKKATCAPPQPQPAEFFYCDTNTLSWVSTGSIQVTTIIVKGPIVIEGNFSVQETLTFSGLTGSTIEVNGCANMTGSEIKIEMSEEEIKNLKGQVVQTLVKSKCDGDNLNLVPVKIVSKSKGCRTVESKNGGNSGPTSLVSVVTFNDSKCKSTWWIIVVAVVCVVVVIIIIILIIVLSIYISKKRKLSSLRQANH